MKKNKFPPLKILVVDDEQVVLELIEKCVSRIDYLEFHGFCFPLEALSWAKTHYFDIVLLDYKMPEMNGVEFVNKLKSKKPDSLCIMMTQYANLPTAVKAIRAGVFDFLPKPFSIHEFELSMQRARKHLELKDQNIFLHSLLKHNHGRGQLIGRSLEMDSVRKKIKLFAASDTHILITGETGVGKEIVSRMVHALSNRNKSNFVAVNCCAFAETLLESEIFGHEKGAFTGADRQRIGRLEFAKGGTILLDEICEAPLTIQTKLLRVLQEKEFERVGGNEAVKLQARVISTTNRNVENEVRSNSFREDLYYRLNTFNIHIPPLRERKSDIEPLASYFLRKYLLIYHKEISSFADGVMKIIINYPWPGNVRQLEKVIDYAVLSCDAEQIGEEHLPEEILLEPVPAPFQRTAFQDFHKHKLNSALPEENIQGKISDLEMEKIAVALERNKWNKTKTAASLGLTRGQLLYRLKKYGIE